MKSGLVTNCVCRSALGPCLLSGRKLIGISNLRAGIRVGIEYSSFLGRCSGWAVVNTQAHREHIAVENLERQEFIPYCPLVKRRRSHARRVTDTLRPLFPGYVFVKINPGEGRWRLMLSTFGVRSVVRCGAEVSLLDDNFIQAIRARELDGVVARPESPYRVGQEVRMSGGSFDGLVGTIIALHERERLTVLMQMLGGAVKVHLSEDRLSPV